MSVEDDVKNIISTNQLVALRDIVRATGHTYSEVNNAIITLTNKIPIYEDIKDGVTVYGVLG